MQTLFVYFAVFVAVLLGADALLRLVRTSFERRQFLNYRLSLIEGNADRTVVYRQMLKERGVNYRAGASFMERIRLYLSQSGLRFDWRRIALYAGAIILALTGGATLLGYSPVRTLIFAVALTIAGGIGYVARARASRVKRFLFQLPDALDVIVRSLAAGHPLPVSVALVAREMPDPIGTEFGIMSDELTYGTDVDTATRNMAQRTGVQELNLLAISLSVQKGAGGNLAEMLANLADMIRRRLMLKAKIRAISAEGRMTSWFMLLFPFGLYGMLMLIRPDYFDPVWASGYGNIVLAIGATLMTIGMLILRKLVNFDF